MVIYIIIIELADNHFDNLHFIDSLETNKTLEMGMGNSLVVSQFLKCRLLK